MTVTAQNQNPRRFRSGRFVVEPPLEGRYDGLILSLLRRRGRMSRSAISSVTGLSATTVTKTVTPLLDRGFVEEVGTDAAARIGRPAIDLRLVPDARLVCGVQIGVGFARAGLVDAIGRSSGSVEFAFDPGQDAQSVLDEIADRVENEVLEASPAPLMAVGIAAPGAVEADHRTNSLSINLGWHDVPMAEIFERRTGLPTAVDHNVRAMALAENRFGAGAANLAFVYVGTGVGLGLVLHDTPFRGGSHGVSELGHIHVLESGERCSCGSTGCLETIVSEPALLRQLRALGVEPADGEHPLPLIERLAIEREDVQEIRRRALAGLGTALASTVNLFSPDLVVVGGALSEASEAFLSDLRSETREQVFPLLREALQIEPSSFGAEAGVVGAASVALEEFYYGVGAPATA
ncbi:ROK family transcriptional regulator [Sinomonas sp. JGH33]|uniref:ROK family transcriptional regulator n=1 Tax=Sinomonas terricola TaxID=3110330 RepID=A0ABU5T7E7_9MICC|nr:ROK family transcriptional regulator [Sinomonas sp. JGH33]MEA5455626.1 ROK family transcriptional regulator [Sinomonas sp. JGH33]